MKVTAAEELRRYLVEIWKPGHLRGDMDRADAVQLIVDMLNLLAEEARERLGPVYDSEGFKVR